MDEVEPSRDLNGYCKPSKLVQKCSQADHRKKCVEGGGSGKSGNDTVADLALTSQRQARHEHKSRTRADNDGGINPSNVKYDC